MPTRFIAILTVCCLGVGASAQTDGFTLQPPAAGGLPSDPTNIVGPRELVAIAPDAAAGDALRDAAATNGYRLLDRAALSGLGLEMLTFERPDDVSPKEGIAALEAMIPASTVGVNHAFRSEEEARQADPRRYAGPLISWPVEGCVAQRAVGVIDGPLMDDAATLAGATVISRNFVGQDGATQHGTAVAELLAGPGRLGNVQLYHAVAVEDVPGRTPAAAVDNILRSIDWFLQNDVMLVNISLAGPYNKILDRGLQAALRKGMVIVAAAGNDGNAAPPRYPAAFSGVIAVTAVDGALAAYRRAASGDHIDLAAPGVDVFVMADGSGRYLSGTSIAAPFVTAALAALWEPGLDQAEVRARLEALTRDLGEAGPDPLFGNGLLQVGPNCG